MITKILLIVFLFMMNPMVFAHNHHGAHAGKIHFPTSGNKVAQKHFEQGVMWLHSFEYDEARAEFKKAIQSDPHFAMAYWGEALSYNHPLWGEQDRDKALKALNQFAPTALMRVKKTPTAKEKRLIHAVNVLYGEGTKKERDTAYANEMCQLYHEYPDDDEIASLYALSLLGATEGNRDFQTYMQAAAIVENIYMHNPDHPGALHYLIHSYDDPIHAPLGLRAARHYAKAAPDASHALHMPSHIFLAMGLWDDVIASNKAAFEAALKQNPNRIASRYTIDDLHALQWLSYAYLQKKDYARAYQLTKMMETIAKQSNTAMAKWYYIFMRAAYITESRQWSSDLSSLDASNLELSARMTDKYVNALIALYTYPGQEGRKTVHQLYKEFMNSIPKKIVHQDVHQDYFTAILPRGVESAKIMALELEAEIAFADGKKQEAILLLKKAVALEEKQSFGYGPPIPVVPSFELLSKVLLADGQYDEAYRYAIVALKRMPNRHHLLEERDQARKKLNEAKLPVPDEMMPYFNPYKST